jgi:DNA-binding MarR family transcriptional regulator/GNAT superfamily N-acetyltransferase
MATSSVTSSTTGAADERVGAVRRFSRFYTNVLGLLQEGLLETDFSLTEARVIFELASGGAADGAALRQRLDIDPGYLSRVLARLEKAGVIFRERSESDGRRQIVTLTGTGHEAAVMLNDRSNQQVSDLLGRLPEASQRRLAGAMAAIEEILGQAGTGGTPRDKPAAYLLRAPGPGDLGWIVREHGLAYAQEYGFDATFEGLVAQVVADYGTGHDPDRESAWIAEVDGAPAGCVLCVRRDEQTAQLRVLLVDPAARGLGIGARLVTECVAFARRAGYARMVLWTNDILTAARHVYQRAGFVLVSQDQHRSYGHDLTGEWWELDLR